MDDWRYDILKEGLQKRDPNYVPKVGAELKKKVKIGLNYLSGWEVWIRLLQRKKKNWKDGKKKILVLLLSLQINLTVYLVYYLVKKGRIKLFTRGTGTVGADISYLCGYLNLPELKKDINIRGELIMRKDVFEKKYKGKKTGKRIYKNARNMVSGLVGAKTARKGLKDIDLVCYEIVGDETMNKPLLQIEKLKKLGFKTVRNTEIKRSNH